MRKSKERLEIYFLKCEFFKKYFLQLNQLSEEIRSYEELEKNWKLQALLERVIHRLLEVVFDIGKMFISDLNLPLPQSYAEIFETLARNGVISEKWILTGKKIAGCRNILVHGYDRIDLTVLYSILKQHKEELYELVEDLFKAVNRYFEEHKEKIEDKTDLLSTSSETSKSKKTKK